MVKARGESMAAAAKLGKPHGMLSVIGLSDADLEAVINDLRSAGTIPSQDVCQLANYLFPQVPPHTHMLDAGKGHNQLSSAR